MKNLINSIFTFLNPNKFKNDLFSENSIEHLATLNAINRRRNARVNYPHVGAVGELPQIIKDNKIMTVKDISTGGVCLYDLENLIDRTIGTEFELDLKWPDKSERVLCTLVAFTNERLHIQFKQTNTPTHVRLNLNLKPGFLGSKFHMVPNFKEKLDADEMWIGPTGEWLTFLKTNLNQYQDSYAEINYGRVLLSFSKTAPPRYNDNTHKHTKGQTANKEIINEILILLSNFKNPTIRVKDLIENLNQQYKQL